MSGFAEKALTVEIPYFYPFVIPSEARYLRRLFCHSEQCVGSLPLVLSFRAKRGISAACFVIPSEARNLVIGAPSVIHVRSFGSRLRMTKQSLPFVIPDAPSIGALR